MARVWTARYLLQKAELSLKEVVNTTSPGGSVAEYARAFLAVFNKPLTMELYMGGSAMAPTLGHAAGGGPVYGASNLDKLVVRQIKSPSAASVFVGDVVAFHSPLEGKGGYLVRRVAATEGEEMVSDAPEDEGFTLDTGTCWVLADNEELSPSEAVDSRVFGPLALESVVGRVVYYARSATEHGLVQNSEAAHWIDEPVLECEIDPEALAE
mmetsp:Transcript_29878/g.53491  ORF Transcript_29878/g.53491 Transcript_29878/m.53491 type:complete len:211 (-) Transcript_29878:269-901(-)